MYNYAGSSTSSSLEYFVNSYNINGTVSTRRHGTNYTYFTYDGAGRLVKENVKNGNATTYTYDLRGNRLTKSDGSNTVSYTYDLKNQLLSASDGTTYTYDANGNRITKTENGVKTTYTFDKLNRLAGVSATGLSASYTYDGSGLRTSKTVNGTTTDFITDGGDVIAEITDGTVTQYFRGVDLCWEKIGSGKASVYHYNLHGDTSKLTNTSLTTVADYDYDAFGNLTSKTASVENPFLYCGEYMDSETGLIYLRARYYDPSIGAFISEDPAHDGLNWYAYCAGDPVNFVDSWGLDAILINKPVDNELGNTLEVEHMAAFFQDENNDWWFFSWKEEVYYVKIGDRTFKDMDDINSCLKEIGRLNNDNLYRDSVYIVGDFTASHEGANELINNQKDGTKSNYNLVFNNCTQVTMNLFGRGVLRSGVQVSDYVRYNGCVTSVLPNTNMNNMQNIFYNDVTNTAKFSQIVAKLIKEHAWKDDYDSEKIINNLEIITGYNY